MTATTAPRDAASFSFADFQRDRAAVLAACASLVARLTLQSLKINKTLSEETVCFSAVVLLDGAPVADASNRGHGGGTLVRFRSVVVEDAVLGAFKALAGAGAAALYFGFDELIDEVVGTQSEDADWRKFAARWNKKGWTCVRLMGSYARVFSRDATKVAAYVQSLTAKGETVLATL
jgi:hypothetical protein